MFYLDGITVCRPTHSTLFCAARPSACPISHPPKYTLTCAACPPAPLRTNQIFAVRGRQDAASFDWLVPFRASDLYYHQQAAAFDGKLSRFLRIEYTRQNVVEGIGVRV